MRLHHARNLSRTAFPNDLEQGEESTWLMQPVAAASPLEWVATTAPEDYSQLRTTPSRMRPVASYGSLATMGSPATPMRISYTGAHAGGASALSPFAGTSWKHGGSHGGVELTLQPQLQPQSTHRWNSQSSSLGGAGGPGAGSSLSMQQTPVPSKSMELPSFYNPAGSTPSHGGASAGRLGGPGAPDSVNGIAVITGGSSASSKAAAAAGAEAKAAAAAKAAAEADAAAEDDDYKESAWERFNNLTAVVTFKRHLGRVLRSQPWAIFTDVMDVFMFALDVYTDVKVVQSLSAAGYTDWVAATCVFIIFPYLLMAVLVSLYFRRTAARWSLCGGWLDDQVYRKGLWLLALPAALPVVVGLDLSMMLTSTAPIFAPKLFAHASSFMSNYKFSRLFMEFVFEAIPQTCLQTYIYYYLLGISLDRAGGASSGNASPPPSLLPGLNSTLGGAAYNSSWAGALNATLNGTFTNSSLVPPLINATTLVNATAAALVNASTLVNATATSPTSPPPHGLAALESHITGAWDKVTSSGGSNSAAIHNATQQAVVLSLIISAINVVKFSWRLWKAAEDAGLRMHEYFKYLLLLKGNYECSPATMTSVIQDTCSLQGDTFVMNGFLLHRNKSKYGPAQQAFILLNSFDRFNPKRVRKWVCSGCPLASINKILETGLTRFKRLECLEVTECALRGDTFRRLVGRAIKSHKSLEKVKVVQTGILKKYRNRGVEAAVAELFRPKLQLTHLAICANWWSEAHMTVAAQHLRNHPTMQSVAIEFPIIRGGAATSADALAPTAVGSPAPQGAAGAGAYGRTGGAGGGMAALLDLSVGAVGAVGALGVSAAAALVGGLDTLVSQLGPVNLNLASALGLARGKGAAAGIISAEYVYAVVGALASAPRLHSLYLHNHAFTDFGTTLLAKALETNATLTCLSLKGSAVGDGGAMALARALRLNTCLSQLNLGGCGLGGDGVGALAAALVENSTLKALDISRNRVTCGAVCEVARALRVNASLTSFKCEGWGEAIYEDGQAAGALCAALALNRTVTRLSFAATRLGTSAAHELAAALEVNGALTHLDLSLPDECPPEQRLGDEGVAALMEALTSNTALGTLLLQGNAPGDRSAAALSEALRCNEALTHLDLSRCGVTDGQLATIASGLRVNTSLQTFAVGGVAGLGLRGVAALGKALKSKHSGLTCLDLSFAQLASQPSTLDQHSSASHSSHQLNQQQHESHPLLQHHCNTTGGIRSAGGADAATAAAAGQQHHYSTGGGGGSSGHHHYGSIGGSAGGAGAGGGGAFASGDEIWACLASAVEGSSGLKELRLAYCGLDDAAVSALAAAASSHPSLTALDLSGAGEAGVRRAFGTGLFRAANKGVLQSVKCTSSTTWEVMDIFHDNGL